MVSGRRHASTLNQFGGGGATALRHKTKSRRQWTAGEAPGHFDLTVQFIYGKGSAACCWGLTAIHCIPA